MLSHLIIKFTNQNPPPFAGREAHTGPDAHPGHGAHMGSWSWKTVESKQNVAYWQRCEKKKKNGKWR